MNSPAPLPPQRPWPMGRVAAAIVVFIIGYTFVTLHYRKPNRAYEPYNDLKTRGQTHNLLTAGFQRVPLTADQPADTAAGPATPWPRLEAGRTAGGLPAALKDSLFDQPALPSGYTAAYGATTMNALLGLTLGFECDAGDAHHQLAGAYLYVQGDQLIIAPEVEPLAGGLTTRRNTTHLRVVLPGGVLKPGRYQVLLAGRDSSLTWTLQVN
ncbi:MAG: hypothetical protein ACO3DQ_09925 [Cephaloticoccus sp.]